MSRSVEDYSSASKVLFGQIRRFSLWRRASSRLLKTDAESCTAKISNLSSDMMEHFCILEEKKGFYLLIWELDTGKKQLLPKIESPSSLGIQLFLLSLLSLREKRLSFVSDLMAKEAVRTDLDGKLIEPITICIIGAGDFIGSHICEELMMKTPHKVLGLDLYNDKIKHLLEPDTVKWKGRIEFHRIDSEDDSRLHELIKMADMTINLAGICTPAAYNKPPLDTINSNLTDALRVVKYCSENNKRLIQFSTCETIGSYLPEDHPLREDPIERLVYEEGAENGLEFTIVRPFNWVGPRMDFIPGIDGPSEGVPRVMDCFSNNLLRGEPLKLVDGGKSQRTFIYIKDAIEAVLLMIENPQRANGHFFNVGNPNKEVTVRQLAEMMTEVYARVSRKEAIEIPTVDVTSEEFYGEGYDDCDKRIPNISIINRQLGWDPKTSLPDLLELTLTYQHMTYADAVSKVIIAQNLKKQRDRGKKKKQADDKIKAERDNNNRSDARAKKEKAKRQNQANRVKGINLN